MLIYRYVSSTTAINGYNRMLKCKQVYKSLQGHAPVHKRATSLTLQTKILLSVRPERSLAHLRHLECAHPHLAFRVDRTKSKCLLSENGPLIIYTSGLEHLHDQGIKEYTLYKDKCTHTLVVTPTC